ncbi:hypothetical protein CMV_015551 [Castanea mollissima]|uniref:Protein kinase domain-containing protein n=1 Tax=Castanea mollissima TaxID=60419 RepID=A0A8J4VT83_9ROSI|nr:hypothetical protein CMV_015551 [Castanea mollissima]
MERCFLWSSTSKGHCVELAISKTVAIKVLNLARRGASKSFKAEFESLRNIGHQNLVKLLTTYSGIDDQGQDFKALRNNRLYSSRVWYGKRDINTR